LDVGSNPKVSAGNKTGTLEKIKLVLIVGNAICKSWAGVSVGEICLER